MNSSAAVRNHKAIPVKFFHSPGHEWATKPFAPKLQSNDSLTDQYTLTQYNSVHMITDIRALRLEKGAGFSPLSGINRFVQFSMSRENRPGT
jgi:hypothetical protein